MTLRKTLLNLLPPGLGISLPYLRIRLEELGIKCRPDSLYSLIRSMEGSGQIQARTLDGVKVISAPQGRGSPEDFPLATELDLRAEIALTRKKRPRVWDSPEHLYSERPFKSRRHTTRVRWTSSANTPGLGRVPDFHGDLDPTDSEELAQLVQDVFGQAGLDALKTPKGEDLPQNALVLS